MEKEYGKWKDKLKQKNDANVLLTKEALKLISKYQQKMYLYSTFIDNTLYLMNFVFLSRLCNILI